MKQKSKSKTNISKPYAIRPKKIRKKSPKIIDYNKVAQKYGNLLETSLNVSTSTQQQKALNNNIDDSCYDYIIDNIYETNNINQNMENSKNNDSSYYFTFKQKKMSSINNSKNNSGMNIVKNKKIKNRAPISIISNKEEINKYFNDRNNINNISSIKNYNNNYNTFSKQIKKTKSLKTNISYKNDIMTEKNKKIEKIIYTNYKTNKSYNNIKIKDNKKIKNDISIKEKLKPKKLSRINSQENNFSKKFNFNNNGNIYKNMQNYESIQVRGNESIKEDILKNDKNKDEYNINIKLKEKVVLLLNLCRKYAYKFNKLFPLCESVLSNNDNNQSLNELKNTITQFYNMIFNKNIYKIFELNENQKDLSKILNNEETQSIKELSDKLDILKKNELIQQNKINNLSQKLEILKNEIENKDNIIKDLKSRINVKIPGKIKEFNGLIENYDEMKINQNIKLNENNSNKKNKNNSYNKMNNKNYNNEKYQIDEIKSNINNNKLNFDIDENQPFNTEIEKLDMEIYNLKSKLKKIIQK